MAAAAMRRESAPFAALADLTDGPLAQLLAPLTIEELRLLPLVCSTWRLDGSRVLLWYGLAAHHGIEMPKPSSRASLRSKADLRRTFFTQHLKEQAARRRHFDEQAGRLVLSMRSSDSVAQLRQALESTSQPPLPVAHELGARARDESATLLHAAARYGRLRCARLLLDKAAEQHTTWARLGQGWVATIPVLEVKDAGGFTPLLMAAWCGHLALVKLLLSRGARIEPQGIPPMTSACGGTGPYDAETWAARKGFEAVAFTIRDAKDARAVKMATAECQGMQAPPQDEAGESEAEALTAAVYKLLEPSLQRSID